MKTEYVEYYKNRITKRIILLVLLFVVMFLSNFMANLNFENLLISNGVSVDAVNCINWGNVRTIFKVITWLGFPCTVYALYGTYNDLKLLKEEKDK